MYVNQGRIIAEDGRILLSDLRDGRYQINVWDRLYCGSLECRIITRDTLVSWNSPNSCLYDYFFRVGGGVTFLEIDDLLEGLSYVRE